MISGATLSSADDSDTPGVTETANTFLGSLTGATGEAVDRSGSFLGSFMQNGSTVTAGIGRAPCGERHQLLGVRYFRGSEVNRATIV